MILVRSRRLDDGRFALQSVYDQRFVEIAHTLPGLKFDRKESVWLGYGDSVQLFTEQLSALKVAKCVGDKPTHVPSLSNVDDSYLHNYQKHGVAFILALGKEGAFLADDMGLGKTVQTLKAIERLPPPTVIVSPAIIKQSWVKEGAKLGIDVLQLNGVKPPDKSARLAQSDGVIVVNYQIVHAWVPILETASTFVIDESHNITNSESRQSKACKHIAYKAKNRVALSGTPFTERPIQLWNVMDTISPGRFGSYIGYAKRYCAGFQEDVPKRGGEEGETQKIWNVKGSSHEDELGERLKWCMLRRTKKEVNLELPPLTREMIEIDVPRQELGDIPTDIDDEWMRWALSLSARGKLTSCIELVKNHLANRSSVVLACFKHEIANETRDILAQAGIDAYMATGEQSVSGRLKAIDEASKNTPSVLVVTTHSVGEGINTLVYADVAMVLELDYSPRWIRQFEGRFHRPGQNRNVLIEYIIGKGTLDEKIRDRVIVKLKLFDSIIGKSDSLQEDLIGNDNEEQLLADLGASLREL